jgi:hypothetical protein
MSWVSFTKVEISTVPPSGVNFKAFERKFSIICKNRDLSP